MSSSGHLRCPVVFDDLAFAFRDYDPFAARPVQDGQRAVRGEAGRRWADDGIVANALMPGGIFTNLQRHVGGGDYIEQAKIRFADAGVTFKTPEQVRPRRAARRLAVRQGITGRYFEDCREATVIRERTSTTLAGVATYALDPANAERLWDVSLDLTGLR